jgi:hypothetical protein
MRMACSLLYRQAAGAGELNSKPSLHLEQLYLMGGVETIGSEVIICKLSSSPIRLYAYIIFIAHMKRSKVSKLDHVTHLSGHFTQCVVDSTIPYTPIHTHPFRHINMHKLS